MPGCRHAIIPGETGLLVPVRNARAILGTVETLIADPDRLARLGAAARRLAERRYDNHKIVSTHMEIYQAMLPD